MSSSSSSFSLLLRFLSLSFFLSCSLCASSFLGIDSAGSALSTSTYSCLLRAGYSFVITRAWHSTGSFDSLSAANLRNAQSAGYSPQNTSVYMFPCASSASSATAQMNAMIADLAQAGAQYARIWLDIEYNPSSACSWAKNSIDVNCDIILALGNAAVKAGKEVGVYSNHNEWGEYVFFGDYGACAQPAAAGWPLWYADYDRAKNFDDFVAFGGWKEPVIKQYQGDATVCGADVDENWEPKAVV